MLKKLVVIMMLISAAWVFVGCNERNSAKETVEKFLELEKQGKYLEAREMLSGVVMIPKDELNKPEVQNELKLNHLLNYGKVKPIGNLTATELAENSYQVSFKAKVPVSIKDMALEKMGDAANDPNKTKEELDDLYNITAYEILKSGNYPEQVTTIRYLVEYDDKSEAWKINPLALE